MHYPYANATEVLPPDLLAEVQKHWQGILFVPAPKPEAVEEPYRKEFLAIQSGRSAREVARDLGISIQMVYYVARKLGPNNPYAGEKRGPFRNPRSPNGRRMRRKTPRNAL